MGLPFSARNGAIIHEYKGQGVYEVSTPHRARVWVDSNLEHPNEWHIDPEKHVFVLVADKKEAMKMARDAVAEYQS